jgi:hypothetical protein
MKTSSIFILIILILTCCHQRKSNLTPGLKQVAQEDTSIINKVPFQESKKLLELLTDSILANTLPNNTDINFIPDSLKTPFSFCLIKKNFYNKLLSYVVETDFPKETYPDNIFIKDSLLILKFSNNKTDTLIDRKKIQRHHSITGYWKEKNILAVHYQDWEESDYYLISMTDGNMFILNPIYKISPLKTRLITFSNTLKEPTYSNGFLIAKFGDVNLTTESDISSPDWAIEEANWLDDTHMILNISIIDKKAFNIKETVYSLIKFDQK